MKSLYTWLVMLLKEQFGYLRGVGEVYLDAIKSLFLIHCVSMYNK